MALLDKNGLEYMWGKVKAFINTHTGNTSNPHSVTKDQLGLGNVNNTADSAKYVAYASESGTASQVENSLIVRLNGGRTESSNMFTFNGSTGRTINITPAKIGAVAVSQGVSNAGKIFYVGEDGNATVIDIATLKTLLDSVV